MVLNIALGHSIKTKVWKNKKWSWEKIKDKLLNPVRTGETLKEYQQASKTDKSKIKDVGGFVGGHLRNGKRSPQNVNFRQILTLDVDFATFDFWDSFTMFFDCEAVLHATHSHTEEAPRFRLVLPIDREVTREEYTAIGRKVAGIIGIELFDNTTFQPFRLMFWPSISSDVEYYVRAQTGAWLNADSILDMYTDWQDSAEWPTAQQLDENVNKLLKKQQDPTEKKGLIGYLCRAYTMSEGIEKFLQSEYSQIGEGRYTYLKGSTAAGLVLYEEKYAYSHHGTDPISGKLCNLFDLIRIHKFGYLDGTNGQTDPTAKKSFKAMEDFVLELPEVRHLIGQERLAEARYDFKDEAIEEEPEEATTDWMENLTTDRTGKYKSTADNLNLIFLNDPNLKNRFKYNLFDNKPYVFPRLVWRTIKTPEPFRNVDYSGIRNYIESTYQIVSSGKIDDCINLVLEKNAFHPIREYLDALEWDGIKRVDTVLTDYFGTQNNLYAREAIRKTLVAAVARVYEPGIKYDYVLTLVGSQGAGKSTFVQKLGKGWASDSFQTVQGKEAFEQLQGAWLIEMAELSGLRKAEVEAVKHFITKQEDTFRPAYGRTIETYKRQCVFIGTTNNKDFLMDPSGNRRFLPVNIELEKASKDIFKLDGKTIDQIWGEAVILYLQGEELYLSEAATKAAKIEQRKALKIDERQGLIEDFLNMKLPRNWDALDTFERRLYVTGESEETTKGEVVRKYVCIAEIWCECLGKLKEDMDKYKTKSLNEIMRTVEGWEVSSSTRRFANYGIQRYFYKL